jgi:hypothetical protein
MSHQANSVLPGSTMRRIVAPLIVGVTSHRNIPVREVEPIRRRVRDFLVRLKTDFPQLPLVLLSALAEGGDQLAAEEALALDARLIAALPMARAEYARDFADGASRARFDSLCAAAEIIEVPYSVDNALGTHVVAPVGQERDLRYAQAGVYVSDHCHILLAIWDGKAVSLLGGTAQIVNYHLTGVKPSRAERRRSEARSLLGNESERLAYHIVCSRDQADGSPVPPLQPLQTLWRTGERSLAGEGPMPEEFLTTFAHTDEFNVDSAKYSARITARAGLSPAVRSDARFAGAIDQLFQAADWLAIHFQRRVLLAMRALYTLAALMGIAFAVYDNLPAQDNMLFVFLLLFALGGFIVVLANRRGWHRKYLDYRALAEGLRVQSYWHRAGISLTGDAEFARDNFLQKQDVELGWVRNVMRGAALESGMERRPEVTDVRNVIREWVGDEQQRGQLDYYQRKAAQRARTHRFTETIGFASLCVGIGISIALAVFGRGLSPDEKNILVMTMAVFSIVAGVRAAYAYKKADKELIKQYRYMQRIFNEARIALDRAARADEQREILRLLGEAALAEQVEWALMHRQRPLEHNRL